MQIVIDIETNSLTAPTEIWCIVCKDIDTGEYIIFREVTKNEEEANRFRTFVKGVTLFIGHNFLEYDHPCLNDLLQCCVPNQECSNVCDTLILSRLLNYSREGGHSIDQYGYELGLEKIYFRDFSKWSQEMEDYCVRDVDICHKVYTLLMANGPPSGLALEQKFQIILNGIHNYGFSFNTSSATKLLNQVQEDLHALDGEMEKAFLPKVKPLREVHPRLTRYGTLHRGDFRFVKNGDLSEFNGGSFTRIVYEPFNASSHKQVVDVLHTAGWKPVDRTETHIDTIRQIEKIKRSRVENEEKALALSEQSARLVSLEKYGWKVNENNLSTLPVTCPPPARLLAKRILLESRRRTLVEWLSLVRSTNRIHGDFYGIGAWTHRMAHQKPNTANIPNSHKEDGSIKLLGKELRSLWQAPPGRVLLGVDAEGIQLRIFAHYVDDPELTKSLINGRKADYTDPHNLNKRVLGPICKTRQAAKRFLYALLLGGGVDKFSQILECTKEQAQEAVATFNKRYPGFAYLKRYRFPSDAKRGFFEGLDGRRVYIPGDDEGTRKHLCMSGYLQSGEAIIIKTAAVIFNEELKKHDCFLVDIIHDEYQIECPSKEVALEVAPQVASAISRAGDELGLKCPMAGSYWNDDKKDYTIGQNWYLTH